MIEFKLDLKSGVPFHRQIVDQIRYGIASKRLLPGEQLPTVRDLAVQLQINPNTARKAYSDLELLGILDTQQGTAPLSATRKSKSATTRSSACCGRSTTGCRPRTPIQPHAIDIVEHLQRRLSDGTAKEND
jgi:GntR family transcriptional regulator